MTSARTTEEMVIPWKQSQVTVIGKGEGYYDYHPKIPVAGGLIEKVCWKVRLPVKTRIIIREAVLAYELSDP